MKSWQDDLLMITDLKLSEAQIVKRIQDAATTLEFEYCAYGLQAVSYTHLTLPTILLV